MKWGVSTFRRLLAALLVAGAALCGTTAKADSVLWYNGNWDGADALVNETQTLKGRVYENFIVPMGTTYTITGAFSNDFMRNSALATTASWEIRSGVSAGNGGTLIASGDSADTKTATGNSSTFGGFFVYNEFKNQVAIPSITLAAGTYWLSVAPDTGATGSVDANSLVSTTSGAAAIGMPQGNDGNSFFSSTDTGANFTPTDDPSVLGTNFGRGEQASGWDFSMGVIGNAADTNPIIPEPSSLALLIAQGLTLAGYGFFRRWKKRSAAAVVAAV